MNYAPLVRIALRYIAGILLAYSVIDKETANMIATDPALLELVLGIVAALASEGWYRYDKLVGKPT